MKKHVFLLPIMLSLILSGCGTTQLASTDSDTRAESGTLFESDTILDGIMLISENESSNGASLKGTSSQSRSVTPREPGLRSVPSVASSTTTRSSSQASSSRERERHSEPLAAKPIIYFYPEEEMDLSVTVTKDYLLTTTYPEYDSGWNIHLDEDGMITIPGSTRDYYALYYEANSDYDCTFEEGFYVTAEDAASFLEEKLDFMGFTNRETDEFIMYWLPILENNGQSLVYFAETEELNVTFPLVFSEEPDTLIRTMMYVQAVDGPTDIREQQLTHYDRIGFTVTEWGGSQY
jgi:hypothetical protein